MPDLIDAATAGNLNLVLAIIVVALSGAVGYLFKLVVDELRKGRERAEKLTDQANVTNAKFADTFDRLADTTEAALNELRKQ